LTLSSLPFSSGGRLDTCTGKRSAKNEVMVHYWINSAQTSKLTHFGHVAALTSGFDIILKYQSAW